jgi:hypothetical protein
VDNKRAPGWASGCVGGGASRENKKDVPNSYPITGWLNISFARKI